MADRSQSWMRTWSGRQFWPLDPNPDDICIEDIAHHLSQQCRWAGATRVFFSTAQHSYLVSRHCAPEDALWGLLHDATEAYCSDIVRPLKRSEQLAGYRDVEAGIMAAVCRRFGLPLVEPVSVIAADDDVMRAERRDLLTLSHPDDAPRVPTIGRIIPVAPPEAEVLFLTAFRDLTAARAAHDGVINYAD